MKSELQDQVDSAAEALNEAYTPESTPRGIGGSRMGRRSTS
jgi:hypothetical protein